MSSVVVVGAGIAGLTCAWRLRRAGHDVEVLESEGEAGGRMRRDVRGDFVLDRGAQFIASGYRNLHGVASAVGIADRVRRIPGARGAVLRDGELHRNGLESPAALLTTRLLSMRAKARLLGIVGPLARSWRHLDPLHPERAEQLDGESLATGLRRVVGEECSEFFFEPIFRATFDCEPEQLSWPFALLALRLAAGGMRLQTFQGGTGLLTETLAEKVSVRVGCRVTAIETEGQGARVHYRIGGREGRVVADAVVVAVPGSEVADLCPKLTPDERGFFEQVRYVRGAIAYLLLEEAPRTAPAFGVDFPRSAGLGLLGMVVDHRKPGVAPPGGGLINAALTTGAADRLWNASDAQIGEFVVEELARTPIGRLRPKECVVHRHAPMLPLFEPGYLTRLARFLRRFDRSPRIAFAGDYLIGPYTEAALTSGMRAATEIVRRI